jgi:hypothetical protein
MSNRQKQWRSPWGRGGTFFAEGAHMDKNADARDWVGLTLVAITVCCLSLPGCERASGQVQQAGSQASAQTAGSAGDCEADVWRG